MTTLAELETLVQGLTGRPDLGTETRAAIQAATTKWHSTGYYHQDLLVGLKTFASSLAYQTLAYKTEWPRFRALRYLKRPVSGADAVPLTACTSEDFYSVETNVDAFTLTSLNLDVRFKVASGTLLYGVYLHPDVAAASYASWIADEFPNLIAYEAASTVFMMIQQKDKAATFQQLAREQLQIMQTNKAAIVAVV